MKIIIRSSGERTEDACYKLAKRHGQPEIIRTCPFGESIRQTYDLASNFNQKWTPVIDADVLLYDNTIRHAIQELNQKSDKIFCLDGSTRDMVMMKNRRAGVHIYRTELVQQAKKYVDDRHIKPETNVRRHMQKDGFPTWCSPNVVFGQHDYEQYYRDLWRKAVCQTRKLSGMVKKRPAKWKRLAKRDNDFLVIYNAYLYGIKYVDEIIIDARQDYGALENLRKLKLTEKGEYRI